MPISDTEKWKKLKDSNTDGYGGACVLVAERVMQLLDNDPGDFDASKLVRCADKDVDFVVGGITVLMAGTVAAMVTECHSRGDEFRRKWNCETQIADEGDRANESGGVLNPALLNIGKS